LNKKELGMVRVTLLATALVLGIASPASAQDADVVAGKAYAEEVCAVCHAVLAGEDTSPNLEATPFEQVAATPGMTEMALSVFLQTPHVNMPNFVLEQDAARNVIAYIRSLDPRE
jgi:mono/diheme cytochrome c family protein